MLKWTRRVINAIRGQPVERPSTSRVFRPLPQDTVRDYPGAGLTPNGLVTILREADDGSLSSAMQLFEEMEEKDPHLFSVANTRRLAVTGLPWRIVSASEQDDSIDRSPAEEAAAYCREALAGAGSFDHALQHLALAIGRNISIVELVWAAQGGSLALADLVPVDGTRIVFDDIDLPRILTEGEPTEGEALTPNKFAVHTPHSVSGHPQRGGLLRVTALVYLAKNLGLKQWMIFMELFGMPIRVGRYEPQATPEEKGELLNMLDALGTGAAGIFSKAVDLQIVESFRTAPGPPHREMLDFLNREMSKAWLGQTLTVDTTGQSGSFAASKVHDLVRHDILKDDLRKEARTVRHDILRPLVELRFGPDAPVPYFQRESLEATDKRALAEMLGIAVNQLGARVPARWAATQLGIPQAADDDLVLSGQPVTAAQTETNAERQ